MSIRISTVLAVAASGAAAVPAGALAHGPAKSPARASAAQAKSVAYRGRTRHGDPISFKVAGSRITKLSAYVPTLCLPTEGLPMSGTDPFDPPGAFKLGATTKVTAKRDNAIWDTSQVTKNFFVTSKRDRTGRITGKLHVDYSFLQILFTYPISSRPYVCTGDTTFRLSPRT